MQAHCLKMLERNRRPTCRPREAASTLPKTASSRHRQDPASSVVVLSWLSTMVVNMQAAAPPSNLIWTLRAATTTAPPPPQPERNREQRTAIVMLPPHGARNLFRYALCTELQIGRQPVRASRCLQTLALIERARSRRSSHEPRRCPLVKQSRRLANAEHDSVPKLGSSRGRRAIAH